MDLKSSISKREKNIFFVTIAAVCLALLYSFVVEPLYREYTRLNQEIKVKQMRLAKNLRLMNEKDIIKGEFKKYSDQFKSRGSEEEEMASVLTEIERIGKATGIYLNNVKPQKIKDMDFYKIMQVEIRFEATMDTLSKFIYELQNSSYLLKPNRLQINSQGGDSSLLEGIIQINKISLS
jgi:Tfp pilus assembly protein PilO